MKIQNNMKTYGILLLGVPLLVSIGYLAGRMDSSSFRVRETNYRVERSSGEKRLNIYRNNRLFLLIQETSNQVSVSGMDDSKMIMHYRLIPAPLNPQELKLIDVSFHSQEEKYPEKMGLYQWISTDYDGGEGDMSGDGPEKRVKFYPDVIKQ